MLVNSSLDLEQYFKFNDLMTSVNFNKSKFCFLIGVNPRYEGFYLNVKMRQRQLKGKFEIFSMNSTIDLTYQVKTLSTNPKFLKIISEGNHILIAEKYLSENIIIFEKEKYNFLLSQNERRS